MFGSLRKCALRSEGCCPCSKAAEWDVQAGVTERETETLAPAWGDTFHLCLAEPSQVLKVFLADDGITGRCSQSSAQRVQGVLCCCLGFPVMVCHKVISHFSCGSLPDADSSQVQRQLVHAAYLQLHCDCIQMPCEGTDLQDAAFMAPFFVLLHHRASCCAWVGVIGPTLFLIFSDKLSCSSTSS